MQIESLQIPHACTVFKEKQRHCFFHVKGFVEAVSDLESYAIPVPSSQSKGWVGWCLEGGEGDKDHEPRAQVLQLLE